MTSRRRLIAVLLLLSATGGVLFWNGRQPREEDLFRQGAAAVHRGDLEQARSLIARLRQGSEPVPAADALQGGLHLAEGKYAAALGLLTPEIATGPLRESVLVWSGESFVKLKQLGRAEQLLRLAVHEFPDNEHATRLLAVVYFDLGAMHPAIDQLKRLEKLAPTDYRPHHLAGVIHLDFEQYGEAIADFEQALAKSPPPKVRETIMLDLVTALRQLLKFDQALTYVEGLLPSSRRNGEAALCELGRTQIAAALKYIRQGEALPPIHPTLLQARAQAYLDQRQWTEAVLALQQWHDVEPHKPESLFKLAAALEAQGKPTEAQAARSEFEKISKLRERLTKLNDEANQKPHDVALRRELAEVCTALGLHEVAAEWTASANAAENISRHIKPAPR